MKQPIFIFLLAISCMVLNACKKEAVNNTILINFINQTGAQIQQATANNVPIGTIANNAQTGFIRFESFRIDPPMPDCDFVGILNNDTLKSTAQFYFCGTQKAQLQPGKYTIEVKLYTSGNNQYFDLQFR